MNLGILNCAMIIGFALSAASCSQEQLAHALGDGSDSLALIEAALLEAPSQQQLNAIGKAGFADYYKALVEISSDEPFVLNHHVLANVRTTLLKAGPLFAALDEQYNSVGKWHQISQVQPTTHLSRADVEATYGRLASDYRMHTGWFSKLTLAETSSPMPASKDPDFRLAQKNQTLRNISTLAAIAMVRIAHQSGLNLVTNSDSHCSVPSVGQIVSNVQGKPVSCSGVAISDARFQTAGHCVNGSSETVLWQGGSPSNPVTVKAVNARGNPGGGIDHLTGQHANPPQDAAYVDFPPGTFSSWSQVAANPPAVGDVVHEAGYGGDGINTHTMSCGTSAVTDAGLATGAIVVGQPNSGQGPQQGDSGSPLFNAQWQVIGTASGGTGTGQGAYTSASSTQSAPYYPH